MQHPCLHEVLGFATTDVYIVLTGIAMEALVPITKNWTHRRLSWEAALLCQKRVTVWNLRTR